MTRTIEVIRFVGFFTMVIGGWFHIALVILAGLFVIILAWMNGIILPRKG